MKRRRSWPAMAAGVLLLAAVPAHGEDGKGLAALMQRNLDHFNNLVQTAFFESAKKQLQSIDYQRLRQEGEAIAGIARQAQEAYSRGDKFNELASELQEHAEEATSAAAKENLPEVNVQIGEMAEYCAECHNTYRWQK